MSRQQENTDPNRDESYSSSLSRIANRSRSASPVKSQSSARQSSTSILGDITNKFAPVSTESASSQAGLVSSALVSLSGQRFLEAIDSQQLSHDKLLEWFLSTAEIEEDDEGDEIFQVVNLGCSDGRVSFLLHKLLPKTLVLGLDDRLNLLTEAREKRTEILKSEGNWIEIDESDGIEAAEADQELLGFLRFDIHHESPFMQIYDPIPEHPPDEPVPKASTSVGPILTGLWDCADVVISCLFLHNITLPTFFAVVTEILPNGSGFLLITDVHPDVHRLPVFSQALMGQGEAASREFHSHSIEEIIEEAKKWGFVVLKQSDKKITQEDVKDFDEISESMIGTRCWFSMAFELNEYE